MDVLLKVARMEKTKKENNGSKVNTVLMTSGMAPLKNKTGFKYLGVF